MKYDFGCLSRYETKRLALVVAKELKPPQILLLYGQLGSGKTFFVRAMAREFGIDESQVTSPTFSLINIYKGTTTVYHVDLYRLDKVEEEFSMDLEEIVERRDGILVVEWADRFEGFWPKGCLKILFEFCKNGRIVQMESQDDLIEKIITRWSNEKEIRKA
ncbi:tRNA (adenosine(37)-N6)-threonylcarbamoyltransferase complex ATPase subunit type 1 TsaE [Pseudothermotoga sp. U03pept]|uniref:tRNA (adenosine(37)-N6)-threonylcarbamoyltransferase complex ATPase subunit type 1 TsaE n=1 Tax=Pseudothermotoga sp. U03pept TaxID=3447012 RepID=UPI003EFF4B1D